MILFCGSNLYFDLPYKKAADELGYSWGGFNYWILSVGAIVENVKVITNIQQLGFTVRNTTDGSEPTINDERYKLTIEKIWKITLFAFFNNSRKGKLTIVENKLLFLKSLQG